MAENETAAGQDQQSAFEYPIRVEDAGPATKKVTIEIPQERIAAKLQEQFKDLKLKAAIPGFRPGHAPAKLVEKRFSTDVREEVRRSLVSESYQQAIEKNSLSVIGEPQFDNPDGIKLPEQGSMSFSFQIEVQPEFTLPDLKGLKIKKPKVEVSDEHIDQAMANLREQQGTLVPVEDRGIELKDRVVADIVLKQDGNEVANVKDSQLVVRAGKANLGGILIDDLDKELAGTKPGTTKTVTVKVPDTHPNEAIKGKDVQVEITVKDIKKLELAEIDQAFLDSLGFANEAELRDALKGQMLERIQYEVQQTMREQVNKFLLDSVQLELPTQMSARQADRVVQRRAVDLMTRGVPQDQLVANIERLRTGAQEEAARELKLFFILEKVAKEQNVDVDEPELNGRIAMMAAQSGRRPEKMKQEMANDGTLMNLYLQLREQKAVDKILETAEIEEVDAPKPEKQD